MLKLACSVVVACALVACGSSNGSSGGAPPASTVDASAADASPAASLADAGLDSSDALDANLGSDVYPAPHHLAPLMTNLGGPVLKNAKLVTVTFAGSTFTAAIRTAVDTMVTSPWWAAVGAGYGVGPASGGVYAELPDTVSNKTLRNEVEIPALIQGAIDDGTLPTPDENTIYAFFFPQSTTITLGSDQSCSAFGAYHDSTPVTFDGGSLQAAYAIMPDCAGQGGDQGFDTFSASHEFIEAATDPHPETNTTYYNFNDPWSGGYQGGEVADMCEVEPDSYTTQSGYTVATAWSNAAILAGKNPCEPESDLYYGAAIQTETLISDWGSGNDHKSDGYVLIHPGETKVVELDVFSEAPLPNDLNLLVGQPAQTKNNPTAVEAIPGVTMSLSQTTVRNGVVVWLTLTAAKDVPLGDTLFVTRSILSTASMHDWLAILHVF